MCHIGHFSYIYAYIELTCAVYFNIQLNLARNSQTPFAGMPCDFGIGIN